MFDHVFSVLCFMFDHVFFVLCLRLFGPALRGGPYRLRLLVFVCFVPCVLFVRFVRLGSWEIEF